MFLIMVQFLMKLRIFYMIYEVAVCALIKMEKVACEKVLRALA